jgi:hypothetical protein
LGYGIRRTRTAFEIENIPEKVIELFSKRTDAIGRYIRDNNITDAKGKDQAGAKTRAKKAKGPDNGFKLRNRPDESVLPLIWKFYLYSGQGPVAYEQNSCFIDCDLRSSVMPS